METKIWVTIGSDNGLLPDVTKPLLVDFSFKRFCGIHNRAISHLAHNEFEKYTFLKFLPHFPGTNELTHWG